MKRMLVCTLFVLVFASLCAAEEDDYSVTPGGGSFYALRHNLPGKKPYIEIVGSPIALRRAKNQARKGEYKLDVAGPFAWHTNAARYIQANWDRSFGRRRRRR